MTGKSHIDSPPGAARAPESADWKTLVAPVAVLAEIHVGMERGLRTKFDKDDAEPRGAMDRSDPVKNLYYVMGMAQEGRKTTKLSAFDSSVLVTTDVATSGHLEPTLEVAPELSTAPCYAVLHMLEAALELSMPPSANWKIKRAPNRACITIELAQGTIEEAALALKTMDGVVSGTLHPCLNWSPKATSVRLRNQQEPVSFVSGGVLIDPKVALCALFGAYTVTRRGMITNAKRQLVPILDLAFQVPEDVRERTVMDHLFAALFQTSPLSREGFSVDVEQLDGATFRLSTGLKFGSPREAVRTLQLLEESLRLASR